MNTTSQIQRFSQPMSFLAAMAVTTMLVSGPPNQPIAATSTDKDLAGDVSRYFGQRANLYRDNSRKLAKLDLDGDFNYDGTINNADPADNGAFQQTPPGLVIGKGEMSRVVIRLTPYKINYEGHAKVRMEISGINRDDKSGNFNSPEEETSGMGHIVVWRDASKREKILDSRHPETRIHEWTLDDRIFPSNLQIVPRTLYVEGVGISPRHLGDIRLLVSIFDERSNANPIATFRPSFDHILITVSASPQEKAFVNANVEGVWLAGGSSGK
jgi:hypothetical protein